MINKHVTIFCFMTVPMLVACSDPCMDLAKQICACERNQYDQQSCDLRVEAQAEHRNPTEQQKEACENLLPECTCEKLAAGNMQVCGLAP